MLEQSSGGWQFYQKQMAQCDQRIEKVLAAIAHSPAGGPSAAPPKPVAMAPAPKPRPCASGPSNGPQRADHRLYPSALTRICGVDLIKVCGLNLLSVLMLIGEIGVDMSRWRSARAFCSWLGCAPGAKISGGKVLSRRTRKVNNRASTILRLAAWAAGKPTLGSGASTGGSSPTRRPQSGDRHGTQTGLRDLPPAQVPGRVRVAGRQSMRRTGS